MYNLERFKKAQTMDYEQALEEIRNGRKESHWIWYIFPQLKGLGRSYNSEYYGIDGVEEAKAYMEDPLLSQRLLEISKALLQIEGKSALEILGSPDDEKVLSCMTLFEQVSDSPIFGQVIIKYYQGKRDETTLALTNK